MEVFEVLVCADEDYVRAEWARIIGHSLAELVGGFSVYPGQGGWVSGGKLMHEPHFRLTAYCADMSAREVFNHLSETLRSYKENCRQDTILVVLDGEPYFFNEVPELITASKDGETIFIYPVLEEEAA